jgi:hypothetical protein
MSMTAPHLSPRLIAKSLDDLRSWQLPDQPDLAGMHRGVLRALLATDSLSNLELPLDMRAPRLDDAREITQWEMIANLLAQAEGALCGAAHRDRIAQLHRVFPGHALQLERMRRQAAQRLRRLRVRVDFVCRGLGQPEPASEPTTQPARNPILQ